MKICLKQEVREFDLVLSIHISHICDIFILYMLYAYLVSRFDIEGMLGEGMLGKTFIFLNIFFILLLFYL